MPSPSDGDTAPYSVVLYGATGFTGRRAAAYLAEHAELRGRRWAIAGRNQKRLEELRHELTPSVERGGSELGIIVADAADPSAVQDMVRQAQVVASTAGPFAKYGDSVVDACVAEDCHYVDITGETPWVRRVIDRHHDTAAAHGTRIVSCCGFDSVPADLGTLFLVDTIRESKGEGCSQVQAAYRMKGGLNGGTLASMLTMYDSGDAAKLGDPMLLSPKEDRTRAMRKKNRDQRDVRFDGVLGCWTAPFVMAAVNTRIVRRSEALMASYGEPYGAGDGREFIYNEAMSTGKKRLSAHAVQLGLASVAAVSSFSLGRVVLEKLGPAPGEGPPEDAIDGGYTRCDLWAKAEGGEITKARMEYAGDAGNAFTIRCLCECALELTRPRGELVGGKARGGVLTPATAIGLPLVERLRGAGISFETRE